MSHEVPTVSMFIAAGGPEQGCCYGQHHPKVRFDDSILYDGSGSFWLVRTPLAVRQRRHRVLILRQQKALSAPLRGPFYRYQVWVQR